jgi:hypothetical protein
MHMRACPMRPQPQQEVTAVVDRETTPPVDVDTAKSVIDVEDVIDPEWVDGESYTLVVRAHLDFEIVVNQDVTDGNWGQIDEITGDPDVAAAGAEGSEASGKHGTI